MKRTISYVIVATLFVGLFSCSKSSSSSTGVGAPSVTFADTTTALSGYSQANLFNNADSVIIINTNASSQLSLAGDSSVYVAISLSTPNAVAVGTYVAGGSNSNTLTLAVDDHGTYYEGGGGSLGVISNSSVTLTISTVNGNTISGTYSGTLVSSTNFGITKSVKGTFSASL